MRSYIVLGVMSFTVAVLGGGGSPTQAVTRETELLFRCHMHARAPYLCDVVPACDRDQKLARMRLDGAYRCVRELLRCDLRARLNFPAGEACMEHAAERCAYAQQDQEQFLTIMGSDQRLGLELACAEVNLDTEFLGTWIGLGYALDAATCDGEFGMSLADPADYIGCADRYVTRLHAQLFSAFAPRGQGLLEDNGWCRLFPEEGVNPVMCNSGLVISPLVPQSVVPQGTVGRLRRCQKVLFDLIVKRVLDSHLDLLENCAEAYLNCNLKQARGDLGVAYDLCISDASGACTKFRAGRDRRISSAVRRMNNACGVVTFEDVSEVLGFVDVASSCGADTVEELVECVVAKVPCLAWDIVRFVEPRMLDDVPAGFLSDYGSCGQ